MIQSGGARVEGGGAFDADSTGVMRARCGPAERRLIALKW